LGFSNHIPDKFKTITLMMTVTVAIVGRVRQMRDRQIAVQRTNHLAATNQQRGNVSAINVFEVSVTTQAGDDDGCVLLADMFAGEEAVCRCDYIGQRGMCDELRNDHSLQRGSK